VEIDQSEAISSAQPEPIPGSRAAVNPLARTEPILGRGFADFSQRVLRGVLETRGWDLRNPRARRRLLGLIRADGLEERSGRLRKRPRLNVHRSRKRRKK